MTIRSVYRERIASADSRLKRHINHDDNSWRYAFDTAGLVIDSVHHQRRIPILDQIDGSCTGNGGIGCLGTDPFYATLPALGPYTLDEPGALALYGAATRVDPYPGEYPPDDTGSDGLTIAKVLTTAGIISGYQWTFSLDDALKALTLFPLITGINWYSDMFNPTAEGVVRPTGYIAGGHEIVVTEYDAIRGQVGFDNSWGPRWGLAGRFYMQAEDYGKLLDQQGDATVFVPSVAPAPIPTPDADEVFAAALRPWVAKRHIGANARVASAAKVWLAGR